MHLYSVIKIAYDIYNKLRMYLNIHTCYLISYTNVRFTKYIFQYAICALNYLGQRIRSICDSVYCVHDAYVIDI